MAGLGVVRAGPRRVSAVVALTLAVTLAAPGTGIIPGEFSVAAAEVPSVPPAAVPVEIGRTATTVTYANPDGTRVTHAYSRPLNFLAADGQWRKIDSRIVSDAAGLFKNVAGEVQVRFPAVTGPEQFVSVSKPGWSVGWRLAGATVGRPGVPDGSTIRYADVAGTADLEYGMTAAGVKEVLVLAEAPASPPTWRFPLRLDGVTAATAADGSISFVNAAGVEVGHMPQGVAFDSANDDLLARPAARAAVDLRLVTEPDGQAVEVSVSRAWLDDPARVYPVRVDPSFNAGRDTPGGDAYFRSDQPDVNCNGNCQSDGGFERKNKVGDYLVEHVSVAKFPIGPAEGKRIITGHWNAYMYQRSPSPSGPVNFSVWKAIDGWDENTVTWNTRPNHSGVQVLVDEPEGTWALRDITGFVADWAANPASNHGLVYDRGGSGGNFYSMGADEMGFVNPPEDAYIAITWEEPAPTIFGVSHTPQPAAPGDTVTFNVNWSDPGDTARAVICRTPGVANGTCNDPNGPWAIGGGFSGANPAQASVQVTQADSGRRDYWAYACDSHNACSNAATGTVTVANPAPTATSASDDPDPVAAGATIRFSIGWTDPNDAVRAVVCKTAAITPDGSCVDGAWARGAMSSASPARADYITQLTDINPLPYSYWAYVCDTTNGCSNAITGTFTVQPAPIGIGATNPAISDQRGLEEWRPYKRWDAGANNEAFVNLAAGNLIVQADDLAVPGQGLNLGLTRTYDSKRWDTDSPLGKGWTLAITDTPSSGWGRGTTILADGQQLAFDDADGTRHTFVKGGSAGPGWHSPPGVNLTVTDDFDAVGQLWYKVTRPDGVHTEIRRVGVEYKVTRVADRKGNQLTFAYSGAQLATVTDTVGRTISFTWTNNLITKARYSGSGGTLDVDYGYGADGRLSAATEAAGSGDARTTSYAHVQPFGPDFPGTYLGTITDPRGSATTFTYNGIVVSEGLSSPQVCTLVDRAAKTWTFTHNGLCGAGTDLGTGAVTLINPDGAEELWTTLQGSLVAYRDAGEVDANGVPRFNVRRYDWVNNRIRREVDEAGNVTDYDWTDLGQLQQTRLNGNGEAPVVTDLTYVPVSPGVADLTDSRAAAFSAEERHTHLAYDPSGNGVITASTDPSGQTTAYTHYGRGLLKSVRDPNNHTTFYGDTGQPDGGYHPSGQPTRITDPTGKFATYGYDFLGRLTNRTDREGQPWSTGFDLRGNKLSDTSPHNGETGRWCYDANDNIVLDVSPRSPNPHCGLDGTDGYSTRRTFDARDQLGTVETASDGQRRKHVYGYDNDGELRYILEPRSFDPTTGASVGVEQKTTYERYANNRVSAFIDEEGARTDVTYTPHGHPLRIVDPSSGAAERHNTAYSYTKLGLVRSAHETGHAGATVYDYTAHGEQTVMAQPMGTSTHNAYDANGRLVRTVNAHGRLSLRTYDNVGNLTSISQPTGVAGQLVTTYTHNERNEIATESDPADAAHAIGYDYDGEGRQRFRKDLYNGALQRSTEQTYRSDGRLSERDARYAGTESRRHRSSWAYDAAGNATVMATYANGSTTPNVSVISTTYTSADELSAMTETIYAPGGAAISKNSSFAYNQNGQITSRIVDGRGTAYSYDRRGLENTTLAFGAQSNFTSTYHPSGALAAKTLPNGAAWTLGYDLANRVSNRVLRNSSGTILSGWENVSYDDNDSKLSELYTQRQIDATEMIGLGQYTYDKLDRLTTAKHPLEPLVMPYALDDAGNVVTESGFIYSYTANRLTKRERFPQSDDYSTYDYDRFGNQTQENIPGNVAATNTYDAASHTTSRNQSGFNISQTYDALDRLVRRTDSTGDVTLFFHDAASDQIVLEADGGGATKTTYTLDSGGAPLLSDDNSLPFNDGRGYYVTDPRGSLTQILAGNQNVTAVFAYDDFGKQKSALTQTSANGSSTWDSRLRFQLAPRDGITGQYALGPRMFDPSTYRFIGADQFVGSAANQQLQSDPLTGNRYLYAGSNPANLIDDGHKPVAPAAKSCAPSLDSVCKALWRGVRASARATQALLIPSIDAPFDLNGRRNARKFREFAERYPSAPAWGEAAGAYGLWWSGRLASGWWKAVDDVLVKRLGKGSRWDKYKQDRTAYKWAVAHNADLQVAWDRHYEGFYRLNDGDQQIALGFMCGALFLQGKTGLKL